MDKSYDLSTAFWRLRTRVRIPLQNIYLFIYLFILKRFRIWGFRSATWIRSFRFSKHQQNSAFFIIKSQWKNKKQKKQKAWLQGRTDTEPKIGSPCWINLSHLCLYRKEEKEEDVYLWCNCNCINVKNVYGYNMLTHS